MGLDMYLKASKYVPGYAHCKDEEKELFGKISGLVGIEADPRSPCVEVFVNIGYWRKANQIHVWFVENVQGGLDQCQQSFVSGENLKDLLGICTDLLAARGGEDPIKAAMDLLPPSEGFFFGSQAIDEFYWQDIEHTVEVVTKALALSETCDIHYQASW